jgi:hypothetical protein
VHVIVGIRPSPRNTTAMLLGVHAIRGSASAPTAKYMIARASRTASSSVR